MIPNYAYVWLCLWSRLKYECFTRHVWGNNVFTAVTKSRLLKPACDFLLNHSKPHYATSVHVLLESRNLVLVITRLLIWNGEIMSKQRISKRILTWQIKIWNCQCDLDQYPPLPRKKGGSQNLVLPCTRQPESWQLLGSRTFFYKNSRSFTAPDWHFGPLHSWKLCDNYNIWKMRSEEKKEDFGHDR